MEEEERPNDESIIYTVSSFDPHVLSSPNNVGRDKRMSLFSTTYGGEAFAIISFLKTFSTEELGWDPRYIQVTETKQMSIVDIVAEHTIYRVIVDTKGFVQRQEKYRTCMFAQSWFLYESIRDSSGPRVEEVVYENKKCLSVYSIESFDEAYRVAIGIFGQELLKQGGE